MHFEGFATDQGFGLGDTGRLGPSLKQATEPLAFLNPETASPASNPRF